MVGTTARGDGSGADAGDGIASLTTDEDGILHLVWHPGAVIDERSAQHAMDLVNERCGDERAPMLVNMTDTASLDRGGRRVFSRPCAASAIALLGSSAVDRVLANFFLGVNAAPCPTRFFRTEDKALAWLRDVEAARGGEVGTGRTGTDGGP